MIGSSCVNYHCRCFHLKTNVTVACKRQKSIDENIVRLGDCKKNSCVVPNTHCRLGVNKCVCDENFVVSEDGKECLLQAFYGDPCKQTSQCFYELGHGAVCDSGVCVCDSIHQNVTDNNRIRCSRRLNYGDECKEHHECSTFLGKATMNCIKNECTCRDGYELFDADQNKCVKMPTSTGRLKKHVIKFNMFKI
ncbi:CLUMA_CG016604, isoform A [Clunio marinus]|uniref:CLUMA_CG016604, isoform A n=1 Tax=Clunio marinus TaxID=568069 RepID=A0A1J1ISW5_9DIPT|nr:CLUMA_CG016604, isoform A [Clunio marinus]